MTLGCCGNSDENLIIDIIDMCFQVGWIDLISQSDFVVITFAAYLKTDPKVRKFILLSEKEDNWTTINKEITNLKSALEYPHGSNARKFFAELDKKWDGDYSEEFYMREQRDDSISMNMVVENIYSLFTMLNKTTQKEALNYITKLASIELKNDRNSIQISTLALAELCEWHYYSSLETSLSYTENDKGEIWLINE